MAVSIQLKKSDIYGISTRDRAKFGWLSVENVDLPYIVRDGREKFIPVKMVEKCILCYYPSTYPKELEGKPPLVCTFMKQEESDLLNKCCGKKNGFTERFAKTDPVVKLNDFLDFFGHVKSAYPDIIVGAKTPPAQPPVKKMIIDFGWVLVRDAMIPYILRNGIRFAPLNVIRGAAQMLIGIQVESTGATEPEVACLNDMCQKVGLFFTFQTNTYLTNLRFLSEHDPQCVIQDLPRENPMDFVNTAAAGAGAGGPDKARTDTPRGSRGKKTARPHNVDATDAPGTSRRQEQTQSASRSLQALANMAKGHPKGSPETTPQTVSDDIAATKVAKTTKQSTKNGTSKKMIPPPSGQQKPPTKATVTAPSAGKEAKSSVTIQPMECNGKTISCLVRGRSSLAFALVEAVCRVYFPTSSLVDFIHFLEIDLAVTMYVLKKSEEEAFIEFYGIPTKQLRCNQVIKLRDLRDRMPRLVARFGVSSRPNTDGDSQDTKPKTADAKVNGNGTESGDSDTRPTYSPGAMETNSSTPVGSPGNNSDINGSDETNGTERKSKSLENTIMRLLDKQQNNETDIDYENGTESRDDESAEKEQNNELLNKAPSSNKRKATPRRCSPQKKLTLIIDGVKTEIEENSSNGTEDSDMEDY